MVFIPERFKIYDTNEIPLVIIVCIVSPVGYILAGAYFSRKKNISKKLKRIKVSRHMVN